MQGKREPAIDVEVISEFCRIRPLQFYLPAARVFEMHPRGDGLAGLAVDDFNLQLAIDSWRRRERSWRQRHNAKKQTDEENLSMHFSLPDGGLVKM
jgi:hypothetical protein